MSQRVRVVLVCDECDARNYRTSRRKQDPNRLTLKKFCRTCGRHTTHKESK